MNDYCIWLIIFLISCFVILNEIKNWPISLEACITDALEWAVVVDALSVGVAATIIGEALVDILAVYPVSRETVFTSALEGTL